MDVRERHIYASDMIEVPETLPEILKNYSKEIIRSNPGDVFKFSRQYFEDLLRKQGYFEQDH
jgi:hypothetical protein